MARWIEARRFAGVFIHIPGRNDYWKFIVGRSRREAWTATRAHICWCGFAPQPGACISLFVKRRCSNERGSRPALAGSPAPRHANSLCSPTLVTVHYEVDPRTMYGLERSRRRDGALYWALFADPLRPGQYLEEFLVESWLEHLRQHDRVISDDWSLQETIRAMQTSRIRPRGALSCVRKHREHQSWKGIDHACRRRNLASRGTLPGLS